jgi:hypothetical protein
MCPSKRKPGAAILLGMLLGCADAAPPEPAVPALAEATPQSPAADDDVEPIMKPEITKITDGLKPAHAQSLPVLDRIEQRGRGVTQIRRVYTDGAVYLLAADTRSGAEPSWAPFVTLTEQGVSQLRAVITAELVEKAPPPPPRPGPGARGGLVWVAYIDGQEQVVQTASGSYSALPPFVQMLDDAVTQNVQPAQ